MQFDVGWNVTDDFLLSLFSLFVDESKLSKKVYEHLRINGDIKSSNECRVTLKAYEDIANAVGQLSASCPGKIWVNTMMTKLSQRLMIFHTLLR